jgi:hypothetical protein
LIRTTPGGYGNLKITPELIRQVGVPLFRSLDVMARFTMDPETQAKIQDIRERAMEFMWINEQLLAYINFRLVS